jgi:Caspase domain
MLNQPFQIARRPASPLQSLVLLVTTALCCAWSVAAQPQPQQQSAPDRGIRNEMKAQDAERALSLVQSLPGKTKRFALTIGVDHYSDPQVVGLGGAANDARLLADSLVRYAGFPADQVVLLSSDQKGEHQPTRGNILRRLSNLAAVVPKDGLLLFSFAGHGIERNNQAFLLPTDAQVSDDVNLLEQTAINVVTIKDWIRKTGVGQVLLLLDACRNDPSAGRANADNPLTKNYMRGFDFDVRNQEVQAFATLYATEIGHRAYELKEQHHGYFTLALVEGLRGQAANEKGEVTLSGLIKYLQDTVPHRVLIDLGQGRVQRPFAVVEGYRADELVLSLKDPNAAAVVVPANNVPSKPTQTSDDTSDLSGSSRDASGLAGTSWTGDNPQTGEFTIRFLAGGQLSYLVNGIENGAPKLFTQKGTWKQVGSHIRIVIGNSYSVWEGTLDGDAMKGTASNVEGEKWEWTLLKKQ